MEIQSAILAEIVWALLLNPACFSPYLEDRHLKSGVSICNSEFGLFQFSNFEWIGLEQTSPTLVKGLVVKFGCLGLHFKLPFDFLISIS